MLAAIAEIHQMVVIVVTTFLTIGNVVFLLDLYGSRRPVEGCKDCLGLLETDWAFD